MSVDTRGEKVIKDKGTDWEKTYKTLLESANDGIIIINKMGEITEFNRKAEEILSYAAEEIIGKSIEILAPPEILKAHRKGFKRVLKNGKPYGPGGLRETEWVRKDGGRIPLEMSQFTLDTEGEGMCLGAFFRNIADRKRTEEELQREKDFSKTIIETADVLIVIVDLERKVMLFNKKAEEVTGYSREEVIGKDLFETVFPEVDRAGFIKMSQDLLQGKNISPKDIVFCNKNGDERIVSNRGALLKDSEGNIMGVLGIGLDITERREMQDKLVRSEKLRALGELAGGVAHDFNNMLAAILGRAQLMKVKLEDFPEGERRKSNLELKRGLELIERTAFDGAETVRRIQEFSRTRTDDKNFIPVDLNELVTHSLELTRPLWKDKAERKGIKIHIEKELSPLSPVMGKPSEIREVLTNLINNSLDAMPQGGRITIKTFQENHWVCLKLEDTGIGMLPQVMENIFDPFFTTKGPKSTGLGMSVSYGIITRHRGSIGVVSREGKGAAFTIKIPLKEVEANTEEVVHKTPDNGRKATILIIEDEDDIRTIIFDILSSNGHKVTTAPDGKRGIEIFKKGSFDLVLTDLGMPGISGWEVANVVKKHDPWVIVAVITGWGIGLDSDELKHSDIDFIVNKPFKMDRILNLTQEALELKDKVKNEKGK